MIKNEDERDSILHRMEHWGFYVLPKTHPHSPGHTGLLVAIRETPSGAHFDPESISLQTLDALGVPVWRAYRLDDDPLQKAVPVCVGRVILQDRRRKTIEFFTFGGFLDAVATPGETVYSLRSPAPIIELNEEMGSAEYGFVCETEVLIARQHSRWSRDDVGFGRRLGQLEPKDLYVGSINSVLTQLKADRQLREYRPEPDPEYYIMLLAEKHWLQETRCWPADTPILQRLLMPEQGEAQ